LRGAFVTLTEGPERDLRGCVGFVEPRRGLAATVIEAVRAAADDRRFPAIDAARLGAIHIEISVLGPVAPVAMEDVHVGIHGLIVRGAGRQGLLLPQVAVELSAFTAEVFGEDD
jgi:uncharacterized protein (TIGR00296 family)